MPTANTATVVMSRLARLVAVDDAWLVALRGTLRRLATEPVRLIIGQQTAGSDFVRHAASRLQIPVESLTLAHPQSPDEGGPPERDRIVVQSAQTVFVLTLRTGGNLHQLLRQRLLEQSGPVVLVDLPHLQSEPARTELCELGATTWAPTTEQCRPFDTVAETTDLDKQRSNSRQPEILEIVPFPDAEHWKFLTHTTRACPGPWPGDGFETYVNQLLASQPSADHSPLGSLLRILQQRRLIASRRAIRGGYSVVSLTACPLQDLPRLHQFRPHRVRWDFEPFGLCLRKDWLCRRGARPVAYGDEEHWQALAEQDRPFFQLATGITGIDWSVENEWRHVGDLDLSELTADDVILFVPHTAAARSVANVSDWPITLWPQ
ncbi:hypothetical protein [Schlesneria paludicola]|uniref:hypothetical protein n=1 Tax=Schlesneria paludicola TaxID=360056 RepID=UPI00029A8D9A|nr:hypothetical protein [Schlesneria paludicola]